MEDNWKDVVGYEGLYSINRFGQIQRNKDGLILATYDDSGGYKMTRLSKDGIRGHKRINRAVAESYLPNPDDLPVVMHLDNNKTNNYYKNLRWGTVSENSKQAYDDGLNIVPNTGSYYILSNGADYTICYTYNELSDLTGFSTSTLSRYIKDNKLIKSGPYSGYKVNRIEKPKPAICLYN